MKRRYRILLVLILLAGLGLALHKPLRLEKKFKVLVREIGGMKVNPGWDKDRFPEDAVCYLPPEKIVP